jgi:hypothetical protein
MEKKVDFHNLPALQQHEYQRLIMKINLVDVDQPDSLLSDRRR